MSRTRHLGSVSHQRFPRVSGDEPHEVMSWAIQVMFSPRERG